MITDIEVREILKLKLTEMPYATLSVFSMIQVDQTVFNTLTSKSRRMKAMEKRQAQIQLKQLLDFINFNLIHLTHAVDRIDAQEFIKMKFDFPQFS